MNEQLVPRTADEHKCFESANEQLGKKNTKLAMAFVFPITGERMLSGDVRLIISTEKADPKKRRQPVRLFANFCPFCGVHLK